MKYILSAVLLMGLAFLAGCGSKDAAPQKGAGPAVGTSGAAASAALPAGLILAAAPEGAKDILEVKKSIKEGDEVVIRGRVGGDVKVFVGATMLVTDMSLQSCDMKPGDECKTPWDYCCDPPETIQQHRALVQLVGADGKTLKTSLEGTLSPLDIVVVKGKVYKAESSNFIINATGIFVEKKFKKG